VRTMEEKELREIAELLMKYFVIRDDTFVKEEKTGKTYRVDERLTLEKIADHLNALYRISIYPTNFRLRKGKFVCIDLDSPEHFRDVVEVLDSLNINYYIEYSAGKHDGYHFWIFAKPTDIEILWDVAEILREYIIRKLEEKEISYVDIEVFPRRPKDDIRSEYDHPIGLPLGFRSTGRWSKFVDKEGRELDPLLTLKTIQLEDIEKLWERLVIWEFEDVYKVMDKAQLEKLDAKIEWIVNPLIPKGGLVILYGPPGVGKSFLALHLAREVVHGGQFLGVHQCKQGYVLYINEDTDLRVDKTRMDMFEFSEIFKRVIGYSAPYPKLKRKSFYIDDYEDLKRLARYVRAKKPILVIFDCLEAMLSHINLARAEDRNKLVRLMKVLRDMAVTNDTTFIIIHHPRKETIVTGGAYNKVLGPTRLVGGADVVIWLEKDENNPNLYKLVVEKNRLAPETEHKGYKYYIHEEDGKLVFEFAGYIKIEYVIDKVRQAILQLFEKKQTDVLWRKEIFRALEDIASYGTISNALSSLVRDGYLEKEEVSGLSRDELKEKGKVRYRILKSAELEEIEEDTSL